MSLFVAIRPSLDALEHLNERLQQLRRLPQARELRWQPASLWHVTLAFLGEADRDEEARAAEALDAAAATQQPIEGLRLDGGGTFARQVMWVGLEDGTSREDLARLVHQLIVTLREAGLRPDGRAWQPHLTIARSRSRQAEAVLDALAGYRGPAWRVTDLLLIRSSGGPRPTHQVRATSTLGVDSSQGGAGAGVRASGD